MMRRLLAVAIVGACFLTGGLSREATAGVSDNSFDVTIWLAFNDKFTDRWDFDDQGGFSIDGGNLVGTFSEIDYRFISSFEATASEQLIPTGPSIDPFTVSFSGIQVGNVILASGSSSEGDSYFVFGHLATEPPAPITAAGSYGND
jgi:hypothetical protein